MRGGEARVKHLFQSSSGLFLPLPFRLLLLAHQAQGPRRRGERSLTISKTFLLLQTQKQSQLLFPPWQTQVYQHHYALFKSSSWRKYFKASEQTQSLYFEDMGSNPPFLKLGLPKVRNLEELGKGWILQCKTFWANILTIQPLSPEQVFLPKNVLKH